MFGCVSKPAARASVWNRVRSSGRESPVPSSLNRMVLTATARPITGSMAFKRHPSRRGPVHQRFRIFRLLLLLASFYRSVAHRTRHPQYKPHLGESVSVLEGGEPDNTPRPSIVNFLVFISGNAS